MELTILAKQHVTLSASSYSRKAPWRGLWERQFTHSRFTNKSTVSWLLLIVQIYSSQGKTNTFDVNQTLIPPNVLKQHRIQHIKYTTTRCPFFWLPFNSMEVSSLVCILILYNHFTSLLKKRETDCLAHLFWNIM